MRGTPSTLRGTALIAAGALTLHELRYLVAPAEGAGGHGYLPFAGLAVAVVLALAFAQLTRRVARARRTGTGDSRGLGFGLAWLLSTISLAAIFLVQELLEGALADGRAGGLEAVAAGGTWMALPLAVAVGAIVALALIAARAVVVAAARRSPHRRPRRECDAARPKSRRAHRPSRPSLATHLSGRAPPLAA
jgi:hypothetical protein